MADKKKIEKKVDEKTEVKSIKKSSPYRSEDEPAIPILIQTEHPLESLNSLIYLTAATTFF